TLAYTACSLSFYFHAIKIPMLLVSSDYPLDDTRANGLNNFVCAVEFIRQEQIAGVFVPYQNNEQEMQLHLASRLTSSLQLSSDFFSVKNKPFMLFKNKQFIKQLEIISSNITVSLKSIFDANILLVKPYPALNYQSINLKSINAVLHDLYHSGTACTTMDWGEQYSLIAFLKRCKAEQIPVYLAPLLYSEDAYQSTRELIEQGAIPLWNLSLEAAYVKLLFAYSSFTEHSERVLFLEQDLANEHIQN
ncbi:partial L-asparaginase, partial [Patescibacteria group bacterium]